MGIADGRWKEGSMLSLRMGNVHRQVVLQNDRVVSFPHPRGPAHLEVEIYTCAGTAKVPVEPGSDVFEIPIEGNGVGIMLAVSPKDALPRRHLKDAIATDGYIAEHDLGDFASQVSPSRSATPSETEEQRLAELRNDAVDYIDRFDLRQLMTDMFQQVIRDKPENPLKFMQDYLCHDVSRSRSSTSVSHTGRPPPPAESEFPRNHAASATDGRSREGVNTRMLSNLLTCTPQVSSMASSSSTPELRPEVLVEVDSPDKVSSGTFVVAGRCNARPFYRLLSAEPRYLYYAEGDSWAGWWIAEKLGADQYVERFQSAGALPTSCGVGELGSRVVACPLTHHVVQTLSLVSDHSEKSTIHGMLTETFGSLPRAEASNLSPLVGVSKTIEAHQQAFQALHAQLAAEIKLRQEAEERADRMEDAFEALQLRLSMQVPAKRASFGI